MNFKYKNAKRSIANSEKTLWLLSLIWPFISFYYAIRNLNIKRYRKFILLFAILYGLSYIPIPHSDGSRYAEKFNAIKDYSLNNYWSDITHIYDTDSKYQDVYAHTLFFVSSKITNNVHVFHMISAAVYFFVFLKLMYSLYDLFPGMRRRYFFLFFLGCVFIFNFSAGVNGVRFPLAFMVFSYGSLNLILKNDKKFLLIAMLSPLIHFTFYYALFFLLLYTFVPIVKNKFVLISFIVLSVSINAIFGEFIQSNVGMLSESFETIVDGYTGDGYIERRNEHANNWNWYVQLRGFGNYYFAIFSLLLVSMLKRRLKFNIIADNLYAFAILMLVASIITGGMLDVISNRFANLASFFTLSFLLYISVLNQKSKILKTLSVTYIPIFMLTALVILRGDLYTVSPLLLVGNPLLTLIVETPVSIMDLF